MPHDRFGKLLTVGQTVALLCTVASISPNETACNVQLNAVHPDDDETEYKPTISCNSRCVIDYPVAPPSPKSENINFGEALAALKDGKRVGRSGWNGKGMFLFRIAGNAEPSAWTYTDGKQDNYPNLPFIAMKTATDEVVPWLASQTDILAEDWNILD